MCRRFVRRRSSSNLAEAFRVNDISDDLQPSFNVAPTHNVAVVLDDSERHLISMRWGLISSWASDPTIGRKLINAPAETLAQKAAFKNAFRNRRCLVVADGFYKWQKQKGTKTPLLIQLKSERPFGFAGLYETWTSPSGEIVSTCTIVTTEPNDIVRLIHDRMPVILATDVEDFWLDSTVQDHRRLVDLLLPYPAEEIEAYAVSPLVNSVKNDSIDCIEPSRSVPQPQLFDNG
jgi:putative SOS response-associated peptidase YedK